MSKRGLPRRGTNRKARRVELGSAAPSRRPKAGFEPRKSYTSQLSAADWSSSSLMRSARLVSSRSARGTRSRLVTANSVERSSDQGRWWHARSTKVLAFGVDESYKWNESLGPVTRPEGGACESDAFRFRYEDNFEFPLPVASGSVTPQQHHSEAGADQLPHVIF